MKDRLTSLKKEEENKTRLAYLEKKTLPLWKEKMADLEEEK